MFRALGIAALLVALSGLAISSAQGHKDKVTAFKSAELVSASDVPIPFNSVANGIVLLHVTVGKTGNVEDIKVVRELASVNEVSIKSVKSWVFAPGAVDGKPAATQVAISIVFCPVGSAGGPITLSASASAEENGSAHANYTDPDLTAAGFPVNPTITGGTVVLQAVISSSGDLDYAKVIKDFPGLTAPSLRCLSDTWKFRPAQLNGKPVRSAMVVAFAIRSPLPANF